MTRPRNIEKIKIIDLKRLNRELVNFYRKEHTNYDETQIFPITRF